MHLHMLSALPNLVSLVVAFSTLELSNMTPNVTSVVQPLGQGIIAVSKIQYKKKLLR